MSITYGKLSKRVKSDMTDLGFQKLTDNQANAICRLVFANIAEALSEGEDVYLEGFGRFYPNCVPPKKVKSSLTGREMVTDYKVVVKFNSFSKLDEKVGIFLEQLGIGVSEKKEEKNATTSR